jgi:hypothetical protein
VYHISILERLKLYAEALDEKWCGLFSVFSEFPNLLFVFLSRLASRFCCDAASPHFSKRCARITKWLPKSSDEREQGPGGTKHPAHFLELPNLKLGVMPDTYQHMA